MKIRRKNDYNKTIDNAIPLFNEHGLFYGWVVEDKFRSPEWWEEWKPIPEPTEVDVTNQFYKGEGDGVIILPLPYKLRKVEVYKIPEHDRLCRAYGGLGERYPYTISFKHDLQAYKTTAFKIVKVA